MSTVRAGAGIPAVALLAHQGGWDEILLVLAPIALIAGLLKLAQRRAVRQHPTDDTDP